MRIAVNACGYEKNEGLPEMLQLMALQKTGHELVVFCDKPLASFTGMQTEVIGSAITSLLSKRWWLDIKLPAALKTFRPDLLLNMTGEMCLRTRVPQLLFMDDISFLRYPKQFSSAELLFLKFYLPKYLAKARTIITPSAFIRQEIIGHFQTPSAKLSVVHRPVAAYKELEWQEREQVKDGYADGREYFLFAGGFEPLSDLISVLKAFSRFKKWQRSNMKLLVTGIMPNNEVAEKIRSYKFRDDVIVLNEVMAKERSKLFASAYAFIHTPLYEAHAADIIAAMRSGTPVIASDAGAIPEMAGDAVLYASAGNEETIAAQMIQLHKDEELRTRMIEKGKQQTLVYDGENAASILWQLAEDAVSGR